MPIGLIVVVVLVVVLVFGIVVVVIVDVGLVVVIVVGGGDGSCCCGNTGIIEAMVMLVKFCGIIEGMNHSTNSKGLSNGIKIRFCLFLALATC